GAPHDAHSFPTRRSSDLPEFRAHRFAELALAEAEGGLLESRHHLPAIHPAQIAALLRRAGILGVLLRQLLEAGFAGLDQRPHLLDRKSTRLNSSHVNISY